MAQGGGSVSHEHFAGSEVVNGNFRPKYIRVLCRPPPQQHMEYSMCCCASESLMPYT